jgi:glycosyltransferase involved in cell wall biosynthesis
MPLIIHITEALGAGVSHSVSQLAKAQVASGCDVVLIHSIRPDTPTQERLDILYPAPIRRILVPMVTQVSPIHDLIALFALKSMIEKLQPAVVHLHSSKAGVLGRIATLITRTKARVFYSPRGFAFLREDVSHRKQSIFLLFEKIAARLPGTLVACSESEAKLARAQVKHPHVVLVENSAQISHIPDAPGGIMPRLRIVTSGRLTYQKAPWRFRDLARKFSTHPVDFVWIGGGDTREDWSLTEGSAATLSITGWLNREKVLAELSRADIFVMTSLWEGMPLSLIEAQAAGLPAVVPNVVGCRDVVIDGDTGYVCASDEELTKRLGELIANLELRKRMGQSARNMARSRFSVERMHQEMMTVYGIAGPLISEK